MNKACIAGSQGHTHLRVASREPEMHSEPAIATLLTFLACPSNTAEHFPRVRSQTLQTAADKYAWCSRTASRTWKCLRKFKTFKIKAITQSCLVKCVCVCVCMCGHVRVFLCMLVCVCVCMCVRVLCLCMCACMCLCLYAFVCVYLCVVCVCICVCACVCVWVGVIV